MLNRHNYKLSIIVPVYNTEKYIERCLTSLLQFIYENMEILCIDDGSTDKSGEICEKFALQDKRVKVVHQNNKGLPTVRNVGLAIADGEYISFVDSDDWIDSDLFKISVEFMDKNPHVDIYIGGMVREYPDGSKISIFEETSPQMFRRDEALREMIVGRVFFWYICGKVYRRTIFEGFSADEIATTCEDLNSLWQLFQSGRVRNIWYSPKYKYHYYYNTCGMTEGKKRIERYKSDLYVFEKILKDSDKESAEVMDRIRGRAIQSIYSLLRERYFLYGRFENVSGYLKKAILILNKMGADEKGKSITAGRLEWMVNHEEYAENFFENTFCSIRNAISESKRFSKKYIYGIGIVSQYVTSIMLETDDFDGFVISDGRPGTLTFAGKPVYHLSELSKTEKKVIILAVNRKNQKEIMEGLDVGENTTVLIPDIPEDF